LGFGGDKNWLPKKAMKLGLSWVIPFFDWETPFLTGWKHLF